MEPSSDQKKDTPFQKNSEKYFKKTIVNEVGARSYKYTGRSNELFCLCADIHKEDYRLQPPIINNQSKWKELKNTSIETLKRMLRAG